MNLLDFKLIVPKEQLNVSEWLCFNTQPSPEGLGVIIQDLDLSLYTSYHFCFTQQCLQPLKPLGRKFLLIY
jgi:hypothetical protein